MTRVFDDDLEAGFATRAIHAGQRPEPLAGAIMTPIFQTSTFVQDGLGENKGYEYARGKNPTREALERNVAALERSNVAFECLTRRILATRVLVALVLPQPFLDVS